jgi:hypothetical protein
LPKFWCKIRIAGCYDTVIVQREKCGQLPRVPSKSNIPDLIEVRTTYPDHISIDHPDIVGCRVLEDFLYFTNIDHTGPVDPNEELGI